jgi:hypothetical protein
MGSFGTAIDGIATPKLMVADNDLATGRLIQRVANSPFANSTLIFVIEDDAQDGQDHVDAHRSTFYLAGPYVKQGALVSTHYTTVNVIRTISEILGLDHLSLYDAYAAPMSDLFDMTKTSWSFEAIPSLMLFNPNLNLRGLPPDPAIDQAATLSNEPSPEWWAEQTKGMDFSSEDKVDPYKFNKIIWEGLMGTPYHPGHGPAPANPNNAELE